jgi:thymidine kinase
MHSGDDGGSSIMDIHNESKGTILFIQSPMGSGKTTRLKDMMLDEQGQLRPVCIVGARVVYSTYMTKILKEFNFHHYKNYTIIDTVMNPRICIQVQSLLKMRDIISHKYCIAYDILVLDELSSIYHELVSELSTRRPG